MLGRDGNYYGTTISGGANDAGAIFKMTPSGTVTVCTAFALNHSALMVPSPTPDWCRAATEISTDPAPNGGVGANSNGTAFKVTPSGSFTLLHTFCTYANCDDGNGPEYAMIQASDGNYYGTTIYSGAGGGGVIYKITPSGTFSVFYSFDNAHGEILNGLIQGTDGNFYVTAYQGGANNEGTVFSASRRAESRPCCTTSARNPACADGSYPNAPLIQGTDGNFYGTTVHWRYEQLWNRIQNYAERRADHVAQLQLQ